MNSDADAEPPDPMAVRAVALQKVLEQDFPAIERGINDFLALRGGMVAATAAVRGAIEALRRHIYVEHEFVLPPLQRAGKNGPVVAMSSDHLELWRTMDEMEQSLADGSSPKTQQQTCQILRAELDQHMSREDPIVFRHVAEVLTAQDEDDLRDGIENAVLPPGWVCSDVRTE
ncbi:hemerythrin domain-containing protein [Leekyejoonella antrihumi]|uniref:Hemerythrin-like domain-containing protein n=1 Tax=Leekyejoonella antrihumi TaxID=1660198 RepID=A0A563E0X4_9MICO|nr:hemerythrin domain-containing protein [Leekyejoonella antrihumi]TWP35822.1 hypothetical protein FGL98_12500 [Leekyejoonella antrihumi]